MMNGMRIESMMNLDSMMNMRMRRCNEREDDGINDDVNTMKMESMMNVKMIESMMNTMKMESLPARKISGL